MAARIAATGAPPSSSSKRMPRAAVVHGAVLLLAACGGNGGVAPDARVDAGPCWPLPSTPGGAGAPRTADLDVMPLGERREVRRSAARGDPFRRVHARIRDLPPGDADDIFAPGNPKTKVSV